MKKIVIDTDIGNDSDDAGALAVGFQLARLGECEILAITSSTSRVDGAECIDVISYFYNESPSIGMSSRKSFLDESQGYGEYSRKVVETYPKRLNSKIPDAVSVLRKTLISTDDKVILITLGPLNNLNDLLKSTSCDLSPLTGLELVETKVEKIIIMGGHFSPPQPTYSFEGKKVVTEWNILQDIDSAVYVNDTINLPILYVPFHVGLIKTGDRLFSSPNYESPVKLSYFIHNKGPRESWDPIAVYVGVRNAESLFKLSPKGKVKIDNNGVTTFIEDKNGNHQFLIDHIDKSLTKSILDKLII